jgi:hypothetical protein
MAEDLTKPEDRKFELAKVDGWSPNITPAQLKEISRYFHTRRNGVALYSPMRCDGPGCRYRRECPLVAHGIDLPIDNYCPVELTLVQSWMMDMAKELQLDRENIFDLFSIGAIAINQIMTKRALRALSEEDFIVEHFRAMTPEGVAIFERRVNPSVTAIKELHKSSQGLQQDLMATRREKSKGEARTRLSPSETMKKLQEKLKQVNVTVEDGQKELMRHYGRLDDVMEAEFVVVEKDSRDGSISYKTKEGSNGGQEASGQGQSSEGHGERDGRPIRGEAGGAVREEGQGGSEGEREEKAEGQSKGKVKRDPRTGFLIEE